MKNSIFLLNMPHEGLHEGPHERKRPTDEGPAYGVCIHMPISDNLKKRSDLSTLSNAFLKSMKVKKVDKF